MQRSRPSFHRTRIRRPGPRGTHRPGPQPVRSIARSANGLPVVWVVGYPGDLGGACTELWHVLRLWRAKGLDVRLLNTWGPAPAKWKKLCDGLGCTTFAANPNAAELSALPGLAGGVVISFCNRNFLAAAGQFRELGCRIAWAGCMNWLFEMEPKIYRIFGTFDGYVFQSEHQETTLAPMLARYGAETASFHRIPGYLDPEEFPFAPRPRKPGEAMVYGRLSRAAANKFSTNSWPIYSRIDVAAKRYRVLGWSPDLAGPIGRPPDTVETLAEMAVDPRQFLGTLHGMLQINGVENENWPRTGLEAFASGVPVVVERRGGWQEMIRHKETGFCCSSDAELAHWAAHLAYDDEYRLRVARQAREFLVDELANPKDLWQRWRELFEGLA